MTMRESGDGDRIDRSVMARPVPDIIRDILDEFDLEVFDVHAKAVNGTWTDEWMLEGEATVFYEVEDEDGERSAESVACEYEFKPRHHDGAYDLSRLSAVLWLPEGTVYPL